MCNPQNGSTGQDETEHRRGSGSRDPEQEPDDWLDGDAVLETQLPADLRSALGSFVGGESVDTLGAFVGEVRRLTDGGAIAVADLCHTDDETDHWGTVGGERYYFRCFYDAVILAALEDRTVDVHTVSPGGTVVEVHAVGSDELSVTPEGAVFSFGIAAAAGEHSGDAPTLQDGYAAICPYVRAFPNRDAYERWAETVPAPTVATPLDGATAVAGALAE